MIPPAPRLPLATAIVTALTAGVALAAAYPSLGIWPLAFVGVGLQLVALQGRRFGTAALVGFLFGASYWGVLVFWTTTFLGPLPWGALTFYEGLWGAAQGLLIAAAFRWLPRVWPGAASRLLLVPAAVAGLWILIEAVQSVWPWGGFAWGRVALSQSDSPIRELFPWLGVSGVGFAMVFVTAVAVAALQRIPTGPWARPLPRANRAALVTAIALVLVALPTFPVAVTGTLRVGAVQGDTKSGYFDPPANFGDILFRQVAETAPVYDRHVDVVLWPEGSSEADPLEDPGAAQLWDEVVARAGAPLVGWAVTTRIVGGVREYFNTSMVWDPAKGGETDHYDKKHPVPFGEYVPERAFFHAIVPDLIDLIQREYTPGTTDDVMDVGTAVAAMAICFDIVDDQIMTDGVRQGGTVVFAPTNNADFGQFTDESVQQLAIARIRAIELGRSVVNVSTVGTSAIIYPDGSEHHRLPTYTPGVMVDDVPLSTTMTPAVLGGRQIEWLVCGFGIVALIAGFAGTRRRRR
jgi:apolipoprotein N-acyltransferase